KLTDENRIRTSPGGARRKPADIPPAEGLNKKTNELQGAKTMFRRMILFVVGIGMLTGLAVLPTVANAAPPRNEYLRHEEYWHHEEHRWDEHWRRYEVMYKVGCEWKCSGTYHDRHDAERAAEHLRCEGFAVEVRPC